MIDEQQFQQLIMLYTQLKNGALEIARMLETEDYDSAITMIKQRESVFQSCQSIKRYLDFTPEQKEQADKLYNEIKELELKNIHTLEQGMETIRAELARTQAVQKLNKAYGRDNEEHGSIFNMEN